MRVKLVKTYFTLEPVAISVRYNRCRKYEIDQNSRIYSVITPPPPSLVKQLLSICCSYLAFKIIYNLFLEFDILPTT